MTEMGEAKQRIIVIHDNTCPSTGYMRFSGPCECPGGTVQAALAGITNVEALGALIEASKEACHVLMRCGSVEAATDLAIALASLYAPQASEESCICGSGAPGDYEGYKFDCPLHGQASEAKPL